MIEQANEWSKAQPQAIPIIVGSAFMIFGLYTLCMAFIPDIRPKEGVIITARYSKKQYKAGSWTIGLVGSTFTLFGIESFSSVNPQLNQLTDGWLPLLCFVCVGLTIATMKMNELSSPVKPRNSAPVPSENGSHINQRADGALNQNEMVQSKELRARSIDEIDSLGQ